MQFTIAIITPRYNQYLAYFSPFRSFREKRPGNEAKLVVDLKFTMAALDSNFLVAVF